MIVGSRPIKKELIALVSTVRIERLGIVFGQSVHRLWIAGGDTQGVILAWAQCYLANGCISKQCIVKTFTLSESRTICQDRKIGLD